MEGAAGVEAAAAGVEAAAAGVEAGSKGKRKRARDAEEKEKEQTGSKEKEPEMVKEIISQTPEGKGDESPPEVQTLTKEKNNWRKKKA